MRISKFSFLCETSLQTRREPLIKLQQISLWDPSVCPMTYHVCVTFVILISSVHWLFVTVQSANVKWSHEFPCTLPCCSGHITWCVFTLSGGTVFPSRGLTLAYLPRAQCAASAKNTVQTVTLHSKGKLGALPRFSASWPPLMFSRVFVHVSKYSKSTLWRQTQTES